MKHILQKNKYHVSKVFFSSVCKMVALGVDLIYKYILYDLHSVANVFTKIYISTYEKVDP